jgi:non-heme chloroperoxidase
VAELEPGLELYRRGVRGGVHSSAATIENWWRSESWAERRRTTAVVAFSQTDFTEDLKKIALPVLVKNADDDQIVPSADSAPLSANLLQNGTLKTYSGFPHGMPTSQAVATSQPMGEPRGPCPPTWSPPCRE